jgi:pilus assembly protein CpaF
MGSLNDGLEGLLADPEVSEILLNGGGQAFVERAGRLEPVSVDLDETGLRRVVERIIAPLGLRFDRSSPMVDARLPDGSRLHAVLPPVAVDGTCVSIRRFGAGRRSLADFGLTPAGAAVLRWSIAAGWNVLVSGGTGAGKTTLLNVMAGEVAPHERIVTIEETAELALGHPHVVRLEARPPNAEGRGEVTVRQLVRTALRMRPDRIVVGEVRGGEALDLLLALHTGHAGSLSTLHAHDPDDALRRLEALALQAPGGPGPAAVERLAARAVHAVVQVARGTDGVRGVVGVHAVVGDAPARTRPWAPGDGVPGAGGSRRSSRA